MCKSMVDSRVIVYIQYRERQRDLNMLVAMIYLAPQYGIQLRNAGQDDLHTETSSVIILTPYFTTHFTQCLPGHWSLVACMST